MSNARPYPTVRQLKLGTKFKVNRREYQLLSITDCAALVQDVSTSAREVEFVDADGATHTFTRSGSRRAYIATTTEYDEVLGWDPVPERETRKKKQEN